MVLQEIIEEYKFVYETLSKCGEYFSNADILIENYFQNISAATSTFFKAGNSDGSRNILANSLSKAIDEAFSRITILVTCGYEFYGALKILEIHDFLNFQLKKLIDEFIISSQQSIKASNEIIIAQKQGMKNKELLSSLVIPLQKTNKLYYTLINLYSQLDYINEMLLEPIPKDAQNSEDYDILVIQSLATSSDIQQVSDSLEELSHYFENLGRLCNTSGRKDYYIQKIETGSLLTQFFTFVPIIVATIKLIDFCYPKFIQWRQLYFSDKTTQLKLAHEEIQAIKELLELNPDLQNSDELLETATTRLFKYFKLNPNIKVNGKEYKTNIDTLLLQNKSSDRTIDGNKDE